LINPFGISRLFFFFGAKTKLKEGVYLRVRCTSSNFAGTFSINASFVAD